MSTGPAPQLDPGTLLFAISVFAFVMAGMALSSASAMSSHRAPLVAWAKAMTLSGVAFIFYFLRGYAPWLLTYLVANALVVGTAAYGHFAFARLLDVVPRARIVAAASAFAMSGVAATYALDAPARLGVVTVSAGLAVLLGMSAVLLVREVLARRSPASIIAAGVTGLMAVTFTLRAGVAIVGDSASVGMASNSAAQFSTLLMGAMFIVASSVGFITMVHERHRQAMLDSVRRDGLTGVYTRTAFFEIAGALERRAAPAPYAVVMVDIDHFKQVNDTFGHAGGDVALAHAARLIAGSVRISDTVGRYGGEEFCIVLPGCGEAQVAELARRVVRDASTQVVRLPDGRAIHYTLSAGYAATSGGEAIGAVIERADQALYRAKRQGRNRAVAADERPGAVAAAIAA